MAQIDPVFQKIRSVNPRKKTTEKINKTIQVHGYDWGHSSADWYRKSVTKRLRKQQQGRCCYCRRTINFNKGAYEVDHIIDKGSRKKMYSRFCFEFMNLALACKDCNNNKGTKSVLVADLAAADIYPSSGAAFNWVHPHFHRYSDHILIHHGWIYEAVDGSAEGLKVIEDCELYLLSNKEVRNRELFVRAAASLNESLLRAAGFKSEAGLQNICKEFGALLAKKWNRGEAEILKSLQDLAGID